MLKSQEDAIIVLAFIEICNTCFHSCQPDLFPSVFPATGLTERNISNNGNCQLNLLGNCIEVEQEFQIHTDLSTEMHFSYLTGVWQMGVRAHLACNLQQQLLH